LLVDLAHHALNYCYILEQASAAVRQRAKEMGGKASVMLVESPTVMMMMMVVVVMMIMMTTTTTTTTSGRLCGNPCSHVRSR
jgi:hypothetical protein